MAIILLGHQPIDFTYSENGSCENLSGQCLHYETGDNPMFQVKADGSSIPLATIKGVGETEFEEDSIPIFSQGNGFFTYQINFTELGITEGCFEVCIYDSTQSSGNLVTNGTFGSNLNGWTTADGLYIDIVSQINPTDDLTCDGEIEVFPTGGTSPYEWSIDGENYTPSIPFTPFAFTGLCYNIEYTIYLRDANFVIHTVPFQFRDCSEFAGSEAFDIKDIYAFELQNCEAFDFV